jgi:hypothetical protein
VIIASPLALPANVKAPAVALFELAKANAANRVEAAKKLKVGALSAGKVCSLFFEVPIMFYSFSRKYREMSNLSLAHA